MKRADAIKIKIDEMLENIAGYLRKRFQAEPDLQELRFPSTHKLCSTLIEAGVSLWTFSDAGVAAKLNHSCKTQEIVRGCRVGTEWVFYRHDYE